MQLYLLHKKSPVLGDHKYSSRLTKVLNTLVLLDAENCLPAPQVCNFDVSIDLLLMYHVLYQLVN